jgi:hypothetical protein
VEFLIEVVERAPAGEAHIILDNLSAHKSQVIRDFLGTHLNVHFHFTPTYSSWRARREPCHSQAVAYEFRFSHLQMALAMHIRILQERGFWNPATDGELIKSSNQ